MPPPRKVDQLPPELKGWLHEWFQSHGSSGYEALSDELNFQLEEAGLQLRIGKSALHAYGQEYAEFVKAQEAASLWAQDWMRDNGLEEEAQRHNVLFQMMTTVAFKVLVNMQGKEGKEIEPRDLAFLGKMMKDLMTSSGVREKLIADERERAAKAAREEAAEAVRKHAGKGGLTQETVNAVLSEILGAEV